MKLETPVKAYNVDGTKNKKGTIKSYVNLEFSLNGKNFKERFYATRLRKEKIILGSHGLRNITQKSIGKLANSNGKLKSIWNDFFFSRKRMNKLKLDI